MTRARLTCLALVLAACGDDASVANDLGASSDLSASSEDLSTSDDLAVVDLATVVRDFAASDLARTSGLGGHCNEGIAFPHTCQPGLVCISNGVPDVGGTCANPDAGACGPNGASCAQGSECCSVNCVVRADAGVCCVPGGCP